MIGEKFISKILSEWSDRLDGMTNKFLISLSRITDGLYRVEATLLRIEKRVEDGFEKTPEGKGVKDGTGNNTIAGNNKDGP